MNKFLITVGVIIFSLLIIVMLIPDTRAAMNYYIFNLKKTDDSTKYETIKKVEDTARAMIASYESDILTYEQYKDSENKEKQEWAEQAKMRANKTASSYNNYILQNSFIWKENIPDDIRENLDYIE